MITFIVLFSFFDLLFSVVKLLESLSVEVDTGVEEVWKGETNVEEVDYCKVNFNS